MPDFTDPSVIAAAATWADPVTPSIIADEHRFNHVDGNINRKSFLGMYFTDSSGRPLVRAYSIWKFCTSVHKCVES